MYRLYGSPGAASMAPQGVLEEIGADYEFVPVEIGEGAPRDPAYLKLNPQGRVPTLVHDGRAMFETAATSLYLAERHPEANLVPARDDPARGTVLQWLVYLTNTYQETMLVYFYPHRYSTDASDAPRIKARAGQTLERILGIVDAGLQPGPYLAGARYGAADILLFMLTGWQPAELKPLSAYPNVARHHAAVGARPAMRRLVEKNRAG